MPKNLDYIKEDIITQLINVDTVDHLILFRF